MDGDNVFIDETPKAKGRNGSAGELLVINACQFTRLVEAHTV
jgi:hypothetical protein